MLNKYWFPTAARSQLQTGPPLSHMCVVRNNSDREPGSFLLSMTGPYIKATTPSPPSLGFDLLPILDFQKLKTQCSMFSSRWRTRQERCGMGLGKWWQKKVERTLILFFHTKPVLIAVVNIFLLNAIYKERHLESLPIIWILVRYDFLVYCMSKYWVNLVIQRQLD